MAARIEENLKADTPGYRYSLGMWVGLASVAMLFTSLSSAYIVRAGSANDWFPLAMPRVLLLSTGVIIVSSVTIEMARRKLKAALADASAQWLLVTMLLGIGFLASQLVAWKQLAGQGVYLASNPHSSFFYLLTAAHAVHLIAGLLALIFFVDSVATLWQNYGVATSTGGDRRNCYLLAFHGRTLDLPILTPIPLEVTG